MGYVIWCKFNQDGMIVATRWEYVANIENFAFSQLPSYKIAVYDWKSSNPCADKVTEDLLPRLLKAFNEIHKHHVNK